MRSPLLLALSLVVLSGAWPAAQEAQLSPLPPLAQLEGPAAPPSLITLQDALELARKNDAQFQASSADALVARQDSVQARSALLPALSATYQYIGNQANGVNPNGRFVSMDGVNMYRTWAVVHQEVSANTILATPYRRAQTAEAIAQAKLEIAQRGLALTVTRSYYALITAQRRYATSQLAAQQALRFFEITQQQESAGQVAHSDAVKAELAYQQLLQSYQESALAMDTARLGLAVILFPTLTENFTVVDDLNSAPALPPFTEVRTMAERANPDLRVAAETLRGAGQDVRLAQNAFLPNLFFEGIYGIEANKWALHSEIAAEPQLGVLPNLGYAVTANLSVPVWDWGGLRSRLQLSQIRERQARVELTQTQRQIVANLYSRYNEAMTARSAVDALRHVADLATESLRLVNLRYTAGESTAFEVVDAQNTLVQARNAADEAQTRYRVALADLQTVTGSF